MVGLTAGASAPPKLVDEVADALAGLGPVDREDPPGVEESYKFTLPPMPPLAPRRPAAEPPAESTQEADAQKTSSQEASAHEASTGS